MAQMRPQTTCTAWCDCFPGFHSGDDGFCLFEIPHVSQKRSRPTVKSIDLATPSVLVRRSHWEIWQHKAMDAVWACGLMFVSFTLECYSQLLWANATTLFLFLTFDILINMHTGGLNKAQFHTVRFSIFIAWPDLHGSTVFNYVLSERDAACIIVTVIILMQWEYVDFTVMDVRLKRVGCTSETVMNVGRQASEGEKEDFSRGFWSVTSVAGVHTVHDWVSGPGLFKSSSWSVTSAKSLTPNRGHLNQS